VKITDEMVEGYEADLGCIPPAHAADFHLVYYPTEERAARGDDFVKNEPLHDYWDCGVYGHGLT